MSNELLSSKDIMIKYYEKGFHNLFVELNDVREGRTNQGNN